MSLSDNKIYHFYNLYEAIDDILVIVLRIVSIGFLYYATRFVAHLG